MIKLKIEDKVFELPGDWTEVTLRQYIDIAILTQDIGRSEIDKFIQMIVVLSGKKDLAKMLMKIEITEFNVLKEAFLWINTEPDVTATGKEFFIFEGKKFSMKTDYNKLTTGEAITLEMMLKDNKIDLDPLEIAFAILFREVDDKGNLKEFNADDMSKIVHEYAARIKLMDVYELINFFLLKEKDTSSKSSKVSLLVEKTHKTSLQSKEKTKKQTRVSTDSAGSH